MPRFLCALIVTLQFLMGGAITSAYGQGDRAIAIENGWARKSSSGKETINVYFDLTNRTSSDDEIVGIWTPVAESAVMLQPRWRGLKMSMERVRSLKLGAGERVTFHPGGFQISLGGLSRTYHPGEQIPLELRFRDAGRVEVSVALSNKLIVSRKPEHRLTN